jgi:sulfofructose kinase
MTSAKMSLIERRNAVPRILCAGVIVLDEVFRVEEFPRPDGKVQANGFFVNGGCAANAAVAIARLGGRALLAGPMGGPKGEDANGDRVLRALKREHVDCTFCQRIHGLATALSAIFMNTHGDRTIVTYCDKRIAATMPTDADAAVAVADVLLADNCFPDFVQPICAAARRRRLPVVLPPSTRLAPATPSMAALRWRWPKAKANSRPCALAPRRPASNALG